MGAVCRGAGRRRRCPPGRAAAETACRGTQGRAVHSRTRRQSRIYRAVLHHTSWTLNAVFTDEAAAGGRDVTAGTPQHGERRQAGALSLTGRRSPRLWGEAARVRSRPAASGAPSSPHALTVACSDAQEAGRPPSRRAISPTVRDWSSCPAVGRAKIRLLGDPAGPAVSHGLAPGSRSLTAPGSLPADVGPAVCGASARLQAVAGGDAVAGRRRADRTQLLAHRLPSHELLQFRQDVFTESVSFKVAEVRSELV